MKELETYIGYQDCSTVELILASETTLTQSPIVQYRSILDLTVLSAHKLVLFKLYQNNINYLENCNLNNAELDGKTNQV